MTWRGIGRTALVAAGPVIALAIYAGVGGIDWTAARPNGVAAAQAARRSDVVVEDSGIVVRTLPDDSRGSRHQRFLVTPSSGATVLITHNIDLADRVAGLRPGDHVAFRGEFEWNERGGVVHWTHHDPRGRRPGGWIRHGGRDYR